MKNLKSVSLLFVLICVSYVTLQADTACDDARKKFKERLTNLIGRHDYVPSIEHHLEKAETELAIPHSI